MYDRLLETLNSRQQVLEDELEKASELLKKESILSPIEQDGIRNIMEEENPKIATVN